MPNHEYPQIYYRKLKFNPRDLLQERFIAAYLAPSEPTPLAFSKPPLPFRQAQFCLYATLEAGCVVYRIGKLSQHVYTRDCVYESRSLEDILDVWAVFC